MLVDKSRDVIAHVENEPDGDEAGDAVKIDLQEIANDVSVEEFHCDLDGPVPISVLKSMARAKSRGQRNDEIGMRTTRKYTMIACVLRHLIAAKLEAMS